MSAKKKPPPLHPIGTRLLWPTPPQVRAGHDGVVDAPSCSATVTMNVNGTAIVRFDLDDDTVGEPVEPVSLAGAKVVNS